MVAFVPCRRTRIACQPSLWQTAFVTPIHLAWQGVATHVDATETQTEYKLRIDLPGFSAEEVDIELQGDKLTISAKKDQANEGDAKVPQRTASASFCRSFALPDDIREAGISASLDKGVLTVTLPKAEPAPKPQPKTVPVQAQAAAGGEGEAPADAARDKAEGKGSSAPQGQCVFRPWGRCNNK